MLEQTGALMPAKPKDSQLATITDRLVSLNGYACDSLSGIEAKLHGILNRATPLDEAPVGPPNAVDALGNIQLHLDTYGKNVARLEKIYKHLSEII